MSEDFPDNIPRMVNQDFGDLKVSKGSFGHLSVVMWSVIPECDREHCPIADKCVYTLENAKTTKCSLQLKYMKRVFSGIMSTQGKNMTDEQMMRMGFTLIPLYGQLIKFKMSELAITRVSYLNDKGEVKIEPVYAEIRKIIAAINIAWKDIFPYARTRDNSEPVVDSMLVEGDPTYYDNLMAGDLHDSRSDRPVKRGRPAKSVKKRKK